jgi:hypothetical protein
MHILLVVQRLAGANAEKNDLAIEKFVAAAGLAASG